MRLLRKALLKYSTRAISKFQTQWEQHHQPRSARDTIGVQPSEVVNDMPAPVGLVASRRVPVLYLREWVDHYFGILSLVELLFASLVFKKHRCPPDLLCKTTTVRSVPSRYVFYLVAFAAVIQSTSTQDCLLTTGSQVFSHIIFKNVMVLMVAVRIFTADLPWIGSNCRWGKIDIIQGTFLCRGMSPLASLIKSQMLKHFAVCALQEHSHAG